MCGWTNFKHSGTAAIFFLRRAAHARSFLRQPPGGLQAWSAELERWISWWVDRARRPAVRLQALLSGGSIALAEVGPTPSNVLGDGVKRWNDGKSFRCLLGRDRPRKSVIHVPQPSTHEGEDKVQSPYVRSYDVVPALDATWQCRPQNCPVLLIIGLALLKKKKKIRKFPSPLSESSWCRAEHVLFSTYRARSRVSQS